MLLRALAPWLWRPAQFLGRLGMVAFVLLLWRYTWITMMVQAPPEEQAVTVSGPGDGLLRALEGPKRRFLAAVGNDLRRLSPNKAAAASVKGTPANPEAAGEAVTLGTERSQVLALLGNPKDSADNRLVYGQSVVFLKDDRVVGWKIDPAQPEMKVRLQPKTKVSAGLQTFKVGSTVDEVLAVQGTPTGIWPDEFEYGSAEVDFKNGRVVRWKNAAGSPALKAKGRQGG
jgi:hypothetical protein